MNKNGGVNKVMLAGRVIREPKKENTGTYINLHFVVETTEKISSKKGETTHAEYHDIVLNESALEGKSVKLAPNDKVYIQGRMCTRYFVDENNIPRYKTQIVASQIECFNSL